MPRRFEIKAKRACWRMFPCELCGRNPAKIKIEKVIDGRRIVKYVCSECAKRNGVIVQSEQDKRCRVCGKSLSEINRDFTVGCAYCYTEFKNELAPIIERVQRL